MGDKTIFKTGSKPPEGVYVCVKCGSNNATYIVPDMVEKLPECPNCGKTQFYKV